MIIVRKRANPALKAAGLFAVFMLSFVAGCWLSPDRGKAAEALSNVERMEERAKTVEKRVQELRR